MRSAAAGVVLLVAASLALTGCTTVVPGSPHADPAALWAPPSEQLLPGGVFRDPDGRFQLVPPPGWQVGTPGPQGTAVVFADPEPLPVSITGRLNANINVFVAQTPADLASSIAGARQELHRLPGYRPTTDEPVTLADGTQGQLIGGEFTDPGTGLALRNLQLLTVHGGWGVVVTGTALRQLWDRYEQTFRTSLASLTVTS
jgi:hypothetical protein